MQTESRETLVAIVEECLAMDRIAVTIYAAFAANSADRELASFWRGMAAEEELHAGAWSDLLGLIFEGDIPGLFPDPQRTLRELALQHEQLRINSAGFLSLAEAPAQFLAAFRIEFALLHPALERLWQFYRMLRQETRGPAYDYEGHLRRFVAALGRWSTASPELQLLGEGVLRLWTQLRDLSQEASVDLLTRVLNRRGLFGHMRRFAYLARRNAFTAGALLIDIDRFRLINETHGREAGDEVLATVAQTISGAVRRSDLVGRYGGEEFLVFLPQVERGALAGVGEKIRGAVELGTRRRIPATVSVGAAFTEFAEGVEPGLEALIQSADNQLFQAKNSGRNTVSAQTG
jgi:diguanylate cyclase (GGDEF)-like protein